MTRLRELVDEPQDILALFGGIAITTFLIITVIIDQLSQVFGGPSTSFGDIALGALIPISALVYQHFFKGGNSANGSQGG